MVIGVEFDGTIVKSNTQSRIGSVRKNAIEIIKKLQEAGHKCFLWTSREGKSLERAKFFLESKGLVMDGYNESPYDRMIGYGRKAKADIYIDGKNMFSQEGVDWKRIETLLLSENGNLKERADELRAIFNKRISGLIGKELEKKTYGIKFIFNRHTINKIGCFKSVKKSVDNGFSPEEHFAAAEKIKDLFEKSVVVFQNYNKIGPVGILTNYELQAEIAKDKIACMELAVSGILEAEQVCYMDFYLSKGEE